jgi:hypothetical protein
MESIKAGDLRIKISSPLGLQIDNLVYNKHGELHAIRDNDFSRFRHPDMGGDYGLYAIPLSASILEKCGFVDYEIEYCFKCYRYKKIAVEYYKDNSRAKLVFYDSDDDYGISLPSIELKYLHQLQNLYYALTGEELSIQPL